VIIVLKASHALCSHIFSLLFQPAQYKPPQSAPPCQSLYNGYQQQHSYEQNDEPNGGEYWVVSGVGVGGGGWRVGERNSWRKLWRRLTLGTYFLCYGNKWIATSTQNLKYPSFVLFVLQSFTQTRHVTYVLWQAASSKYISRCNET